MCFNCKIEQAKPEELAKLQLERLKKTVSWAGEKSSFYSQKFKTAKIDASSISHLEDIKKLPFTTKDECLAASPYDMLTLPASSVVRVALWEHPEPIVKMYTANDVSCSIEIALRSLTAAGINHTTIIGVIGELADSGLLDLRTAAEMLGATVVMLSTDYERAIKLMSTIKVDVIVGSVRRLLQLTVSAQAAGKDIIDYSVRNIICLNDLVQNPLQGHIERRMNTKAINIFSSSVLGYVGALCECDAHYGGHFQADMFYPELIAFGSDELVTNCGQVGELVITTLASEAMPIIRYRTGQAVMLAEGECTCGRLLPVYATPLARRK